MTRQPDGGTSVDQLVERAGVPLTVARRATEEAASSVVLEAALAALCEPAGPDDETAATAMRLMKQGPEALGCALVHAYAARSADQVELVDLVRISGRLALAAGDHPAAEMLLRAALDLDHADRPAEQAKLLLDLARATDGCGDVAEARDLLSRCIQLAHTASDSDTLIDAAVLSAFPPDWRAGDRQRSAFLDLAETVDPNGSRTAAILAARAMVEMRIPTAEDTQQIAWVTRAGVAQPLADEALRLSEGTANRDRLVALLAWRSTHRSPRLLVQRRAVSEEAVDLAQRLLAHDRLVDAAVGLAVDRLEGGDRGGYDQSVATLRWAAHTDRNPRLRWWAATVTAGQALVDGDPDAARRARAEAYALGERHQLPGWVAAELLLSAETALLVDDDAELSLFRLPDDSPILASPIARSSVALIHARLGDLDAARRQAVIASRALDEEASYLLCLTLLARAAMLAKEEELMTLVEAQLTPWTGHVAVDPSAWWCIGPVDLALAELALAGDRPAAAETHLGQAEPIVQRLGDVRSTARAAALRLELSNRPPSQREDRPAHASVPALDALSSRELTVLRLIARGGTNASIGAELSYSASTIRADTVSIYRKLGVSGRAEAAALAVLAGLTDPRTSSSNGDWGQHQ